MSDARQRILDTASQLFTERGYELVGINELIDRAAVAKATFYQQFRSKEQLCLEWLRLEAADSERTNQELLNTPDIGVGDKIRQKYRSLAQYLRGSHFRGCPFSNTAAMVPELNQLRDVVRDYKQSTRLFWQALALEASQDPVKARSLGDALFLLYAGAVTESQNARSLWPVEAAEVAALLLLKSGS